MNSSLPRICFLYYEQGLTQQQISARLNMSRIKVSRLLKQARDEGIVRFRIKFSGYFPDLEQQLEEQYSNVQFRITSSIDGTDATTIESLGATCAEFLSERLQGDDIVAVGWGRTLMATANHLEAATPDVTFVPIIGGHSAVGMHMHANSVAAAMARNAAAKSLSILAPALANSVQERDTLIATPVVGDVISTAKHASMCVFSVGSPSYERSAMGAAHYHSEEDASLLIQNSAVCDVASISYFDAAGQQVGNEISARAVSLSEDELRAIPQRICVAGGAPKHEALRVAIKLGLPTVVITDEVAARALLET